MIPKIIHYAWFGGEKPQKVQACIDSWHKVMPDWEFKEWNETNWDIDQYKFAREMYDQKNWGFLGDPLRYDVIYKYGGFYFDSDMLLKKPLDEFCDEKNLFCFMYDNTLHTGLFGAEPHSPIIKEFVDMYRGEKYPNVHELLNVTTSNPLATKILMTLYPNFKLDNSKQELEEGVFVWPKEYFVYPSFNKKENYAEHLFANAWGTANLGLWGLSKRISKVVLGKVLYGKISAHRGTVSPHKGGVIIEKMK